MRDLEEAVRAEVAQPSANLAEGIQARVFSESPPRDDSAVLVVKIGRLISTGDEAEPVWHFDARDQNVARTVKREFLTALRSLGPNRPDLLAAEMVYGELISNVVRHTPGLARMHFGGPLFGPTASADRAAPSEDAESGRGLFIIESLCNQINVEPISDGKRMTVALPLSADHDRL
jgi:anti-sigma regulatory factor (Ser/Thr protein kinase)